MNGVDYMTELWRIANSGAPTRRDDAIALTLRHFPGKDRAWAEDHLRILAEDAAAHARQRDEWREAQAEVDEIRRHDCPSRIEEE